MKQVRYIILYIALITVSLALGATAHAARFELSPSSGAFGVGCDSIINIMMSTEGLESDAANIIMHYNPSEIEIIDSDGTLPQVQIRPGSVYQVYADNIAEAGEIRLTGFSIMAPYNSGSDYGNFGAIQFRSLPGVVSTDVTIDYVPGSTLDSNIAEYITSDDILTGVQSGSYTFEVRPCVDDTRPPWVMNPFPEPGSQAPLDSNISFDIRDNQAGVDLSSLVVTVQGIDYTYDGVNRFSYTGNPLDYHIEVNPIEDFIDGAIVNVEIRVEDLDNNIMSPYSWSFNEPPTEPLTCEELGCVSPDACPLPEDMPECEEPQTLEVPESTVSPGEAIDSNEIQFWAADRTVRLFPDSNETVKVLIGTNYSITIPTGSLAKEVENILWYSDSSIYQFALEQRQGVYWTDMSARSSSAVLPSSIVINYADGTTDRVDYRIFTVPMGSIYETDGNEQVPLGGAKITVYQVQSPGVVWNAGSYSQSNPIWTSASGQYGFYVPQGKYFIEVEKPGYELQRTSTYNIQSSILNYPIELSSKPEPTNIIEEISDSGELVADTITDAVERAREAVLDVVPIDENDALILGAAAAALGILNLGTAISIANLLPLLYGLFTQPLLLLGRKKRKQWGVVYNSLSKMPVDLAVVRLVHAQTGKVIRTRVTDREGRFVFVADPGIYRIEVKKPGFIFPTVHLREEKEDFQYLDIYHGEIIQVKEKARPITVNVPLDQIAAAEKPKGLVIRSYLRKAQPWIAAFSLFMAIGLFIVYPSWLMAGYLALQIILYAIFWKLARPRKAKGWGIVYDSNTKTPIHHAIVRIFDSKYNKLLETQVTDTQGKYSFLVGNNLYYATYEKPGYVMKKLSPIDYRKIKEKAMVAYDVGLESQKGGGVVPPTQQVHVPEEGVNVAEAPEAPKKDWQREGQ